MLLVVLASLLSAVMANGWKFLARCSDANDKWAACARCSFGIKCRAGDRVETPPLFEHGWEGGGGKRQTGTITEVRPGGQISVMKDDGKLAFTGNAKEAKVLALNFYCADFTKKKICKNLNRCSWDDKCQPVSADDQVFTQAQFCEAHSKNTPPTPHRTCHEQQNDYCYVYGTRKEGNRECRSLADRNCKALSKRTCLRQNRAKTCVKGLFCIWKPGSSSCDEGYCASDDR